MMRVTNSYVERDLCMPVKRDYSYDKKRLFLRCGRDAGRESESARVHVRTHV